MIYLLCVPEPYITLLTERGLTLENKQLQTLSVIKLCLQILFFCVKKGTTGKDNAQRGPKGDPGDAGPPVESIC